MLLSSFAQLYVILIGSVKLEDDGHGGLKGLREAAETYQQLLSSGETDVLVSETFNLASSTKELTTKCQQVMLLLLASHAIGGVYVQWLNTLGVPSRLL